MKEPNSFNGLMISIGADNVSTDHAVSCSKYFSNDESRMNNILHTYANQYFYIHANMHLLYNEYSLERKIKCNCDERCEDFTTTLKGK